jgi:polyisoprenoid-binding protein YceI
MPIPARLAAVALPLALLACKDPNAHVPRARAAAPAAATAPPATRAANAERLTFGPPQSRVGFTGAKVTGTHQGTFTAFQGTVDLNPDDLTLSRVAVTIEMASVQADDPRLTNHLKSPDFFDIAAHPRATFTSTAVRAGGPAGATHTLTGELSLHGVTRAITFPATVAVAPTELTARAEFTINRRDFGITYPGMPDNLIRDDVALRLELRAARPTPR